MFPIQDGPDIPWRVIAPHEKAAQRNHGGQTLQRLAERGGLGVGEAIDVLLDQPWATATTNLALLDELVRKAEGGDAE